jgi:GH24 family phage-related lysozyme (muramidase)
VQSRSEQRWSIAQNEFDAHCLLAFNHGTGHKGFAGSTVLRRLKAGDRHAAADAFLLSARD